MINADAMKPYGMAIKDFYAGDITAEVKIHRDDGLVDNMAISALFRGPVDFQVDKVLIDQCRGRILDVGAGAGIHSLFLQELGFTVYAMDVSPDVCKVMTRRGVKEVICSGFNDVRVEPFDTLLILGRSITMVETLDGLYDFFKDAHRLINSGGQVLMNSLDVSKTSDPRDLVYQETNKKAGRYIGEIRVHMEYKGNKSPVMGLLHVDPVTLKKYASRTKWLCEILLQEQDGNYAARLIEKKGGY